MKPVSCVGPNGNGSYGGSQMWWDDKVLVNSGCGIVAGVDSLLHMQGIKEIDRSEYIEKLTAASEIIKPLKIPFWKKEVKVFGNEFVGSLGVTLPRLKRGLRKLIKSMGAAAKVRSYRRNFIDKTKQILKCDIPVILLIRAPFNNVTMYDSDTLEAREKLGQHYVTITDYDEERGMFDISSWGRKYKIATDDLRKFSVFVRFCYLEREDA